MLRLILIQGLSPYAAGVMSRAVCMLTRHLYIVVGHSFVEYEQEEHTLRLNRGFSYEKWVNYVNFQSHLPPVDQSAVV